MRWNGSAAWSCTGDCGIIWLPMASVFIESRFLVIFILLIWSLSADDCYGVFTSTCCSLSKVTTGVIGDGSNGITLEFMYLWLLFKLCCYVWCFELFEASILCLSMKLVFFSSPFFTIADAGSFRLAKLPEPLPNRSISGTGRINGTTYA